MSENSVNYCKRVQMLNISNKIGLFTFINFKHLIE